MLTRVMFRSDLFSTPTSILFFCPFTTSAYNTDKHPARIDVTHHARWKTLSSGKTATAMMFGSAGSPTGAASRPSSGGYADTRKQRKQTRRDGKQRAREQS
jgi:hypothetical protein